MKQIFMHVGNVKELILSGNEISSVQGLDRLFSLERLSLDENKIDLLADISSLANLPFLMNLDIKGNPLEIAGEISTINTAT
jgi:Leucine-rich repeat (LRR) protein